MILLEILNDNRVLVIIGVIITALISAIAGLGVFIFNKTTERIDKAMAQAEVSQSDRRDMLQMLEHKFKSINRYMGQTDKLQFLHDHKIKILSTVQDEQKKKIEEHSEKLAEHGKDIEHLKSKGH